MHYTLGGKRATSTLKRAADRLSARTGLFLLFIWSVWFVWLNWTNQMNETNQMNQINPSRSSRLFRAATLYRRALEEIEGFGYTAARAGFMPT